MADYERRIRACSLMVLFGCTVSSKVSEGLERHESNHTAAHCALMRAQRALSVLELFQLDDGYSSTCTSPGGFSEDAGSHGDSSSSSSSGNTTSTSRTCSSNNNTSSSRIPMDNCAEGDGNAPSSSAKLTRGDRAEPGVASVLNVPLPASTSLWPCVPPLVLQRALNLVSRCVEATAQALDATQDLPYSTHSYAPSPGAMNAPPLPPLLFVDKGPTEEDSATGGGACDAGYIGDSRVNNANSGYSGEQTANTKKVGQESESASSFDAAFTELQTNVLHLCFHVKVKAQATIH